MGLFEKWRAAKFFSYCQDYDERNPQTWAGRDLTRITMQVGRAVVRWWGWECWAPPQCCPPAEVLAPPPPTRCHVS